jgi:hypothetical protein
MPVKRLAALAVLLAACGQQGAVPQENRSIDATGKQPVAVQPPAKPFSAVIANDLYEFTFGWPAEAAAIPELAGRFRRDMADARAELVAGAEEGKALRDKDGMDFQPHSSSTVYETAGQSQQLLSLRLDAGGYTGGAHGNSGVRALLWDRQARREINFADLFAEQANRDRLLTQRWCDSLNSARQEKRGEPVGGGGMFDDCPSLDDIAIVPADADKDGRFEKLHLVASPYVAGPWAEGAYEVELAVTPELVAGMKSRFQPSFKT